MVVAIFLFLVVLVISRPGRMVGNRLYLVSSSFALAPSSVSFGIVVCVLRIVTGRTVHVNRERRDRSWRSMCSLHIFLPSFGGWSVHRSVYGCHLSLTILE